MAVQQLKLESVRRKTGGRIHLTPRVPKSGPVTTLCNQTLAAGTFTAVEVEADCSNCIRRSQDQGRISGAFFAQDEGSELLRLSLEQAKFRNPTRGDAPRRPGAPEKPVVWPTANPPPDVIPDQLGELVTRGFRPAGEEVGRSPGGGVLHLRKRAEGCPTVDRTASLRVARIDRQAVELGVGAGARGSSPAQGPQGDHGTRTSSGTISAGVLRAQTHAAAAPRISASNVRNMNARGSRFATSAAPMLLPPDPAPDPSPFWSNPPKPPKAPNPPKPPKPPKPNAPPEPACVSAKPSPSTYSVLC